MKITQLLKKPLQLLTLAFAVMAAKQTFADTPPPPPATVINSVTISYATMIPFTDNTGIVNYNAIIGGTVSFTGPTPIFVTVTMGGQIYTQPTDSTGNFSFFVYSNNTNQFQYVAWSPNSSQQVSAGPLMLQLRK